MLYCLAKHDGPCFSGGEGHGGENKTARFGGIGGLAQLGIVIGVFLVLCVLFPPLGQFVTSLWDRAFHFIVILN